MTVPITIAVDGVPLAKGRPRFGKNGNVFTPQSTRDYERSIGWAAKAAMRGQRPFAGPVRLQVVFELPVPKSWLKPRRGLAVRHEQHPIGKPDIDNLLKAALDAINGVVVADDAQVVELISKKLFSATPKLSLVVTPLADEGR